MSIDWDGLQGRYAVRLIPNPKGKPESRAVAALLAMVRGVSEFGGSFVKRAGGSQYKDMCRYVRCLAEVPFVALTEGEQPVKTPAQKVARKNREYERADGVIVVQRGQTEWKALVEVKVGAARLAKDLDQVAEYHRQASSLGFDAFVTISNEPAMPGGDPPKDVSSAIDGRRARRCPVHHIQWRDLLGDAQALIDKDLEENVEDTDQAWMLEEWIRYVTDEASGILEPATLGPCWTDVLEQAAHSRLQARSAELTDVVTHWIGYSGEVGYRLRLLGIQVNPKLSRKERADPDYLIRRLCDCCERDGVLAAEWRVPGPIAAIRCEVHLGQGKIHYSFDLNEFDGRTAAARVMGWISQLDRDRAPADLRVTMSWKGTRKTNSYALSEFEGVVPLQRRLQAEGVDRGACPSSIKVEWITSLPRKRGQKGAAHLQAITAGMVRFYEDVAAGLRSVERVPRPSKPKVEDTESKSERASAKVSSGQSGDGIDIQVFTNLARAGDSTIP